MKILRVHNSYLYAGGEDSVFAAEIALLRQYGQDVSALTVSNRDLSKRSGLASELSLAVNTVWSRNSRALMREAVDSFRPDIVHFDNTFPLLSPSVYGVAREFGAAVVQTLHNFRLVCLNALCFRNGLPCQDCVGRTIPIPGVVHACYREALAPSSVVASMLVAHRILGTWTKYIDRYVALSEFSQGVLKQGGIPSDRISIKPNFTMDTRLYDSNRVRKGFLFVGRLSVEKGIESLCSAWKDQEAPGSLTIIGDGPLKDEVTKLCATSSQVVASGKRERPEVISQMAGALALILPSICYENFPSTIAEAFSVGTPVIASRLGAMAELIDDGRTGLLFEAGDPIELTRAVTWANANPDRMREMGYAARREYESKYTPDRNYDLLMGIYDEAIKHARSKREGVKV